MKRLQKIDGHIITSTKTWATWYRKNILLLLITYDFFYHSTSTVCEPIMPQFRISLCSNLSDYHFCLLILSMNVLCPRDSVKFNTIKLPIPLSSTIVPVFSQHTWFKSACTVDSGWLKSSLNSVSRMWNKIIALQERKTYFLSHFYNNHKNFCLLENIFPHP